MNEERVKFQNRGDSTLEATIDIKAPPEKVFRAWTQQDQFVRWFGPRTGGRVDVNEFNVIEGGRFDVTMFFDDGDQVQLTGTFQEVAPPTRLAFSWLWTGSDTPTEVRVDLTPTPTGTTLTLTHSRFDTIADRDQHQSGWAPIVARLATVLEGES